MTRWLALMAIVALGSGCALKVPTAVQPHYDYTEYETYDQPLNADVSLGFGSASTAAAGLAPHNGPGPMRSVAPGSVRGIR
jgi:hypothetical protein